ncbi:MAG TPA: hypothetical protein VKB92_03545 [Myxococcales bacterium]|nr:hypothetical protein [Myxococcales bacterium]
MARLLAAVLCLTLAACDDPSGAGKIDDAAYRFAAVSETDLVLHPGETRTLRVVLARDEVGGVPDALVHFEVAGDPGALAIGSPDVATGEGGVAGVSVTAHGQTGSAEVIASAPAFDVPQVRFGVEIAPVRRILQVVGGPGTLVDPGGKTASVTLSESGSTPLRVRAIDADTGEPAAGEIVFFSVPPSARATFGSSGARSARATTNPAGEAQALLMGQGEEPEFEASAFSGSEGVTFSVTVRGLPAPTCDCPAGYFCADGLCEPGVPGDPVLPDVTGVWHTKHAFDLRASLPGGLQLVFGGIRALDQLLSGRLGLPAWLQAVIDSLLEQFLPGWFYAVVRVGDDLGTLLSFLRAEGRMRLSPGPDAAHPQASEVWTSLVFYWLPLCGEDIEGDPQVPPECARLDVATTFTLDSSAHPRCRGEILPAVAVRAAPFTAAVEPVPGSTPARWQLAVSQRQVQVEIGRAAVTAVGAALSLSTPWQCLAEATDCRGGQQCMVDCSGIGQWVSDFTDGVIPAGAIESACAGAVGMAGQAAIGLLASLKFDTDLLVFGGRASIGGVGDDDSVCRSGTSCAGQLGNDDFDGDLRQRPGSRDGSWTGSFFGGRPDLPGSWEAKRSRF